MFKIFPVLDSCVVGLAIFALGACLAASQAWSVTAYGVIFAAAVCASVVLYLIGRKRGFSNVDGVFLGRVPRILAVVIVMSAFGSYWLIPSIDTQNGNVPLPSSVSDATSGGCAQSLAYLNKLLDGLAKKKLLSSADVITVEERQVALGFCDGEAIVEANERAKRLVATYEPKRQEGQITELGHVAGLIISLSNTDTTPSIKLKVFPESETPDTSARVEISYHENWTSNLSSSDEPRQDVPSEDVTSGTSVEQVEVLQPEVERRISKFEYSVNMFPQLLALILFPGSLIFGWNITVEEVIFAVRESAQVGTGAPLQVLIQEKNLDLNAKNDFVSRLLAVSTVHSLLDPTWQKGVENYLKVDLVSALCIQILRESGGKYLQIELQLPDAAALMKRLNGLSNVEGKLAEENVLRCIRQNQFNNDDPGLQLYSRLKDAQQMGG